MHFRDRKSQAIVRISSSSMVQKVQKLKYLDLNVLVPVRKKTMPNSLDFRRKLRMALLEQVGFQKTFPAVPIVFRHAAIQNRDNTLFWHSE